MTFILVVFKPLNIATVLPDTYFAGAINFNERTSSVLLAVMPLTVVNTAIFPLEDALALALVVHEMAIVLLSVCPLQETLAMHFVLFPLSVICLTIGPDVFAATRDLFLVKNACVDAAICKC